MEPNIAGQESREFKWKSDHAFVKISSEDSGGRYTLIEDNITEEFRLPKHMHRTHAEAFYVVSGKVEFIVGDKKIHLKPGDSLYIPPGQPHKVSCIEAAKMLTLYQPGGLEKLFEAYEKMGAAGMADPKKLQAVDIAHDNIVLGEDNT